VSARRGWQVKLHGRGGVGLWTWKEVTWLLPWGEEIVTAKVTKSGKRRNKVEHRTVAAARVPTVSEYSSALDGYHYAGVRLCALLHNAAQPRWSLSAVASDGESKLQLPNLSEQKSEGNRRGRTEFRAIPVPVFIRRGETVPAEKGTRRGLTVAKFTR